MPTVVLVKMGQNWFHLSKKTLHRAKTKKKVAAMFSYPPQRRLYIGTFEQSFMP